MCNGTGPLGNSEFDEKQGDIRVEADSSQTGFSEYQEMRLKLDGQITEVLTDGAMPVEHVFHDVDFADWDGQKARLVIQVEFLLPDGSTLASADSVSVRSGAADMEILRSESTGAVELTPGRGTPRAILDIGFPSQTSGNAVERSFSFLDRFKNLFRLESPKNTLVPTSSRTDQYGVTHVQFEQHVGGFPVVDTSLSLHLEDDTIWRMHGRYLPQGTLDSVNDEIEMYVSGQHVPLDSALDAAEQELVLRTEAVDWKEIGESRPVLIKREEGDLGMAWRVTLVGMDIPAKSSVAGTSYVDIESGEVVRVNGLEDPADTIENKGLYKATAFDADGQSTSFLRDCFVLRNLSKPCNSNTSGSCSSGVSAANKFIDHSDNYDGFLFDWHGLDSPSGSGHSYSGSTGILSTAYSGTVRVGGIGTAEFEDHCGRSRYSSGWTTRRTIYHELTHQFSNAWNNIVYSGASEKAVEEHLAQVMEGVAVGWSGRSFFLDDGLNAPHDDDLTTEPPLSLSELRSGAFNGYDQSEYDRAGLFNHMYAHLVGGEGHKGALGSVLDFGPSPFVYRDAGTIVVHTSMYGGLRRRVSYREYLSYIDGTVSQLSRVGGFELQSGNHLCWARNAMASIGYKTKRVDSNCDGWPDSNTTDDDGDGIPDFRDKCDKVFNSWSDIPDRDGDGVGDMCDQNVDGDKYYDEADDPGDPCPRHAPISDDDTDRVDLNATNTHRDRPHPDKPADGKADRCSDPDGDGVGLSDNCPYTKNAAQTNSDNWGRALVRSAVHADEKGDACDADADGDGYDDGYLGSGDDNCPDVFNPFQTDSDNDGDGDACDDSDFDGVPDSVDNCPNEPNPARWDSDGDGNADEQRDTDGDGTGDACDEDIDGDGDGNSEDMCPGWDKDPKKLADEDGDGKADMYAADEDGIPDDPIPEDRRADCDNCPGDYNPDQSNLDAGDERIAEGDVCDDDDDSDGIVDEEDNCPKRPNKSQTDRDGDGQGWACEPLDQFGTEIPPRVKDRADAYQRHRGRMSELSDFPTRATQVNRMELAECLDSVCGSSGDDRIPSGMGRMTTVEGPSDFTLILTNGEGEIEQRVAAELNSETGDYEASVSWPVSIGAHWPNDSAILDLVITESHFLRIVPTAPSGTNSQIVEYGLSHSMVEGG